MSEYKNLQIVAFVSLPGAGASSAVTALTQKSIPKVHFGDAIKEEMHTDGLHNPTPEQERAFAQKLYEIHGKDVIANKIVDQINHLAEAGQHRVVVDGPYTWTDYKILKKAFPGELIVIAITAPKHIRYHRLSKRSYHPLNEHEAAALDWQDIEEFDQAGPIAIADYFVPNEHDMRQLEAHIDQILEHRGFFS